MERWSWGRERSSWCAENTFIIHLQFLLLDLFPPEQMSRRRMLSKCDMCGIRFAKSENVICKSGNLLANNSLLVVRELPDVRDDPEQSTLTVSYFTPTKRVTLVCGSRWRWRRCRGEWGRGSTLDASAASNQIFKRSKYKRIPRRCNKSFRGFQRMVFSETL